MGCAGGCGPGCCGDGLPNSGSSLLPGAGFDSGLTGNTINVGSGAPQVSAIGGFGPQILASFVSMSRQSSTPALGSADWSGSLGRTVPRMTAMVGGRSNIRREMRAAFFSTLMRFADEAQGEIKSVYQDRGGGGDATWFPSLVSETPESYVPSFVVAGAAFRDSIGGSLVIGTGGAGGAGAPALLGSLFSSLGNYASCIWKCLQEVGGDAVDTVKGAAKWIADKSKEAAQFALDHPVFVANLAMAAAQFAAGSGGPVLSAALAGMAAEIEACADVAALVGLGAALGVLLGAALGCAWHCL